MDPISLTEYTECDAVALAELVRRREVTPGELVASALAAVEAVNPVLNAVIETFDDPIWDDGGEAGAGTSAPPFCGVPFMLKDLGCTEAGRRCEMGSRLLEGWRAAEDTELMRRFRSAGLVNLGRTTTSEFALTATVETMATGTTRNPWNTNYSTAGSSGGSAAAVAAGIVPLAYGNDGGGSIRMPASCCGLVGLKPSRGRVTAAPASSLPGDLAVDFALTRSVRDSAALLDAVAGPAAGDPFAIASPARSYMDALRDRAPLRIAYTTEHFWGLETNPQVGEAVEVVAALLGELGHSVIEARPRFDAAAYLTATLDVWSAMTATGVRWAAAETGRRAGPEILEGLTRAWKDRGERLSAVDLSAALEVLGGVTRNVGGFFEEIDVLLTATIPTLPIKLGQYAAEAEVPATWYFENMVGNLESTTSLFNCTGQPAISLPLRQSIEGLPIGIHLAGHFGREDTLLGLAASLEEASPWADRRPPVHAATAPAEAR